MKAHYYISAYCELIPGRVIINSKTSRYSASSTDTFLKDLYQSTGISYPKFFKMDALSKLAFITSELVFQSLPSEISNSDIALVFANRSSSLDTDLKHLNSIADPSNYYPSPAVFVYTLPNICLGEIAIRHQLKSENTFFVFDKFNSEFMTQYTQTLLESGKAEKVLCGWVEMINDHYQAQVYLVDKSGSWPHTVETLNELYKS